MRQESLVDACAVHGRRGVSIQGSYSFPGAAAHPTARAAFGLAPERG